MSTVTLAKAQANLPDLIRGLSVGEELVITKDDKPVARILPAAAGSARQLGTMKGTVLSMAADFDAPLDDFKEYME